MCRKDYYCYIKAYLICIFSEYDYYYKYYIHYKEY